MTMMDDSHKELSELWMTLTHINKQSSQMR